jgi:hypothetical protein
MSEIKYVRIPARDLPAVFYVDGKNAYFVRYRVTSEDGNVSSRWSQKFEIGTGIEASDISLLSQENTAWKVSKNSDVLNVTWNVATLFAAKKLFVNRFHVYVRFYTEGDTSAKWQFAQETTATNFSTIIPANKKVDVAVLIPTYRGIDVTNVSPASPIELFPESVIFYKQNV